MAERSAPSCYCTNLDGVVDKLLAAVLAGLGAFGTFGHGVLGQESPHHSRSALVLAVDAFLWTDALVVLRDTNKRRKNVRMREETRSARETVVFAL